MKQKVYVTAIVCGLQLMVIKLVLEQISFSSCPSIVNSNGQISLSYRTQMALHVISENISPTDETIYKLNLTLES